MGGLRLLGGRHKTSGADASHLHKLPQLSGPVLRLIQLFWFATFLLVIIGSLGGIHFQGVMRDRLAPINEIGLASMNHDVLKVRPWSPQARAAGVPYGSRLIAIEGRQLSPSVRPEEAADLLRKIGGATVKVSTASPTGEIRHHELVRSSDHLRAGYHRSGLTLDQARVISTFFEILSILVLLVAAALLAARRSRDPVAVIFSFAFLLISLSTGLAGSTFHALGHLEVLQFLATAGWGALILGVLWFPEGELKPPWTVVIAVLIVGWILLNGVPGRASLSDELFAASFVVLAIAAVTAPILRYRQYQEGLRRQQTRWAMLGFSVGTGLLVVTVLVVLPLRPIVATQTAVWLDLSLYVMLSIAPIFVAGGLLISLLRYRLYDVDAAISNSAAVAVMTVAMGAVFAASAKALEVVFQAGLGDQRSALPAAIAAGLAAVVVAPLHGRIQRWAERKFQSSLLYLKRDLPQFLTDLRETASTPELVELLLERVQIGVRAKSVALLVPGRKGWKVAGTRDIGSSHVHDWIDRWMDADQQLEEDRSDPIFPLRLRLTTNYSYAQPVGWLLFGPRPDGSFFGKDEREALSEIARPIARTIQVVRMREAKDAKTDKQIRDLRARLLARIAAVESAIENKRNPPIAAE